MLSRYQDSLEKIFPLYRDSRRNAHRFCSSIFAQVFSVLYVSVLYVEILDCRYFQRLDTTYDLG